MALAVGDAYPNYPLLRRRTAWRSRLKEVCGKFWVGDKSVTRRLPTPNAILHEAKSMQIGLNLAQSRPALVSKYSHDGCVRLPARRGPGRPGIMLEITALIVRMAQES